MWEVGQAVWGPSRTCMCGETILCFLWQLNVHMVFSMKYSLLMLLFWSAFIMVVLLMWALSSQETPATQLTYQQHKEIRCSSIVMEEQFVVPENKLVLFYKFPSYYKFDEAQGTRIFSSCSRLCELTVNESRFSEADLVVFFSHQHIVSSLNNISPVKYPGQVWVFFAVESPVYSHNDLFGQSAWHGLFNWTMTYRYDSEFWHGYLRTLKKVEPVKEETKIADKNEWRKNFSNKTKLVAWFVSNCETNSRRETYVNQLAKHISVDIYGKCGALKCENHVECLKMLRRDYKFYLAFENSLCKDYVTEKLLNVFDLGGVVPVVRGGANYGQLFPANSVIDASRFSSPQHLAKYLIALANDQEAYIKMFEWSWEFQIKGPHMPLCPLCERLHALGPVSCTYQNVYSWWDTNACHRPTDF